MRPGEESVEDIKKASHSTNISQLRSWLGIIQYYHQFLPDLATVLSPMHHLQKSNTFLLGSWLLGAVTDVKGPRNYLAKVDSSSRLFHADHLVRVSEHEEEHGSSVSDVLDSPVNYPIVEVGTQGVNPHSQGPLVTEQSAIPTPSPHEREAAIILSSAISEDRGEWIFESVNPVIPTASGLRSSIRGWKPVQKLNL